MQHRILESQRDAHERNVLNIWTVYDHPADFPHSYVARRFEVDEGGSRPTNDIVQGELQIIRESFRYCGLVRLLRAEADDPKIVEAWL
jgi:hypothetical protein